MVDLENFHLSSYRGTDFKGIMALMQLQNHHISQICKIAYSLYDDFNMINNLEFKEFMKHFNIFMQNHARSEGFSKAMEMIQIFNHMLLENLLATDVLAAAEELEMAIVYFEMLLSQSEMTTNPQIILLNQSISNLEETHLKIIELLESLLTFFSYKHLKN